MIRVKAERDDQGRIRTVTVKGHAGAGPYGFDLVCAGVSAVSVGTVNAIEALCGFDPLIDIAADGGYLRCGLTDQVSDPGAREKAELLLEGMLVALKTIENTYGEHIKVTD